MTGEVERIITSAISAVGAILSAWCVARVGKLHELVNSRMTKLLALTESSAHKQGELEGRDFIDNKQKESRTNEPT